MTYRLTYRRVKASDITNTISPDQIPLLSQPTRVGIPNFSYIRNKRDNDLETTKGNYTTIDGGVARQPLWLGDRFRPPADPEFHVLLHWAKAELGAEICSGSLHPHRG